jgi:hypothetical protein
MIPRVTLTPGGGRSSSTATPPAPPPPDGQRRPVRPRSPRARTALLSSLRWGLLIGGLVIIADLATLAMVQRSFSQDDQLAIFQTDLMANWVLFTILGVVVVRETKVFYAGILAGIFAAIVDTAVVYVAQTMANMGGPPINLVDVVLQSVLVNVGFAAVSGLAYYWIQQRSASNGKRPR